jgi:hypothetical protein
MLQKYIGVGQWRITVGEGLSARRRNKQKLRSCKILCPFILLPRRCYLARPNQSGWGPGSSVTTTPSRGGGACTFAHSVCGISIKTDPYAITHDILEELASGTLPAVAELRVRFSGRGDEHPRLSRCGPAELLTMLFRSTYSNLESDPLVGPL